MVLLLAGCLPRSPEARATSSESPLSQAEPQWSQGELEASGQPEMRGQLDGRCAGLVLLQIMAPGDPRPLTETTANPPTWRMFLPPGEGLTLRYGCDADHDGVVPGDAVKEVLFGHAGSYSAIPLLLPDTDDGGARVTLVADEKVDSLPPPGGPGGGPGGGPDGGLTGPGPGIPDGAVGPPPDANTPPPTGAAGPPISDAEARAHASAAAPANPAVLPPAAPADGAQGPPDGAKTPPSGSAAKRPPGERKNRRPRQ